MDILQNRRHSRKVSYRGADRWRAGRLRHIARAAAVANPNANIAEAPEAATPIAQKANAKASAVTRAAPSPTALGKTSTRGDPGSDTSDESEGDRDRQDGRGKASMSEVRAYADQLVQDHTNVDQTVVAMAQKRGAHLHDGAADHTREGRHESPQGKQWNRN